MKIRNPNLETRRKSETGKRQWASVFVTGTDTGVGKTHVTALLLAELRRRGVRAAAMKPIACGADGRRDAEQYWELMDREVPLDALNPVYLRHPLAPSVAARLARRRIDLQWIKQCYRQLRDQYECVLVEGAGGLLVPICDACHPERSEGSPQSRGKRHRGCEVLRFAEDDSGRKPYFVADLARELGLPVLIVARLGLGTINHTLLTVRQSQAHGLTVAGIVLNDTTGQRRGLAERTNIAEVPRLSGVPVLGVVPHGSRWSSRTARGLVQAMFGLQKRGGRATVAHACPAARCRYDSILCPQQWETGRAGPRR